MSGEGDLPEIEEVVIGVDGISAGDVMLVPEGVRPPAPGSTDWIVRACLARGWRYCPRLHIELFGSRRGTTQRRRRQIGRAAPKRARTPGAGRMLKPMSS